MRKAILLLILFLLLGGIAAGQNVTREKAVQAIENATVAMEDMREANFSVRAMNNTIRQAEQALQRADFARALERNATGSLARRAREALRGLEQEEFTYAKVLTYTQQAMERKERAFRIHDEIRATEIAIEEAGTFINTTAAEGSLKTARTAFTNERYDEAEAHLAEAQNELNAARAERSIENILVTSGRSFLAKYWIPLVVLLAVVSVGGTGAWKIYLRRRLEERREELEIEREVLERLIGTVQNDYFVEEEIPERVYALRSETYRDRIHDVEEELSVIEEELGEESAIWNLFR